jgi:hypothetical protein
MLNAMRVAVERIGRLDAALVDIAPAWASTIPAASTRRTTDTLLFSRSISASGICACRSP